ncbi:MAG: hypothetical protein V3W41_14515 [Planctomycetota bacterium]
METTLDHMGDSLKDVAKHLDRSSTMAGEFRVEVSNALTEIKTKFEGHEEEDERRFSDAGKQTDALAKTLGELMSSRVALGAGGAGGLVALAAVIDRIFGILPG